MNNLRIRQLEDSLIDILHDYDLPIEVKRLVVSNVLRLVEKQADATVIKELSQPITEYGEMKDAESTRREQE